MRELRPKQEWWTAEEIAGAGLPDMPTTKRRINDLAERSGWRGSVGLARRRAGRGGGWEFHWTLFPIAAQRRLLSEVLPPAFAAPAPDRSVAWEIFDALPQRVKDEAQAKLTVLDQVAHFEALGLTRSEAVHEAAKIAGKSAKTIWNWRAQVDCVARTDWLPHLAPRHRIVRRKSMAGYCDPAFKKTLFSLYLRPERPTFSHCYRAARRIGEANGWDILTERTMLRIFRKEVSKPVEVMMRHGRDALSRMYPAQVRDRSCLAAMEAMNADYHKFDVFVMWPGIDHPMRPQMVAFQDVYSGKILSWRLSVNPNKTDVSLALNDLVSTYGIPQHMLFDNGREFANYYLTGGATTRFRYTIKDEDIPGVLTQLGIKVHWASPYAGQSKPIERAFRDMCDAIAKDVRFAGAYTGNTIDAKPENYRSKAIPLDRFLEVLEEGIEEHNARSGRRSHTAHGRSFNETFAESYERSIITRATDEQLRLLMMGAEGLMAQRQTGAVRLLGNQYWNPWMVTIGGDKVVARFDPQDLHAGIHVYGLDGSYLGFSECQIKGGFFNVEDARTHQRARQVWKRAQRDEAKAFDLYKASELGRQLDEVAPDAAPQDLASKVTRPKFDMATPKRRDREMSAEEKAFHQAQVLAFEAGETKRVAKPEVVEDALTRFRRSLELIRRIDEGSPVTEEQRDWLVTYQLGPEFRAQKRMYDVEGDAMFG